jgi:hypothetical protein
MSTVFRLMSFALLIVAVSATSCSSQSLLTEAEAKAAVKDFENDQSLVLKTFGLETEDNPFTASGKIQFYSVAQVADPDPRAHWTVDAASGEVYSAFYGTRIPSPDTGTPFGPYTQSQCRQIAIDFAQDKYADFDNLGFQMTADQWSGHGWEFGWQQYTSYGAVTVNIVNIDINPTTGLIQSYGSTRYEVYSPEQAPTVTSQQAISLAAQAAGITTLDSNDTPQLNASRMAYFWRVNVVGEDSTNNTIDVGVDVDAYSGDTLAIYAPGVGRMTPKQWRAVAARRRSTTSVAHPPTKVSTPKHKRSGGNNTQMKHRRAKKTHTWIGATNIPESHGSDMARALAATKAAEEYQRHRNKAQGKATVSRKAKGGHIKKKPAAGRKTVREKASR